MNRKKNTFLSKLPVYDHFLLIILVLVVIIGGFNIAINRLIYPVEYYLVAQYRMMNEYSRFLEKLIKYTRCPAKLPQKPHFLIAEKDRIGERLSAIKRNSDMLIAYNQKLRESADRIFTEYLDQIETKINDKQASLENDYKMLFQLKSITQCGPAIPEIVSVKLLRTEDLQKRLASLDRALERNIINENRIRMTSASISSEFMNNWINSQKGIWDERVGKLCEPPDMTFNLDQIKYNETPNGYIEALVNLGEYTRHIFEINDSCMVEKIETIDENLLKFSFNHWNKFDMKIEELNESIEKIKELVDKHEDLRNIYVRGHCDPEGDDDYNLVLSYRRAMYVGNIIKQHLESRNLAENRDFFITLSGFGERRLLKKEPNEEYDDWRSRCRRIELAFQKVSKKTITQQGEK